jgi:hypothetical protein
MLLPGTMESANRLPRELLEGRREIAQFPGPGAEPMSLHNDIASAKETMAKLRALETEYGAHIALAHDASWLKEGSDPVLMSLLDERMKRAAKEKIVHDEIP